MTPERFRRLKAALDRRQPDLTVLMERVHKSHNFSAMLRNCDAAGVLEAHVVPPEEGMGLHHGTSAGTRKWIRVQRHGDVVSAVRHLKSAGFRVWAAHPSPGARDYRHVDFTLPTAIMMGAELHGVSSEGLAAADGHVTIPMKGMVHSLNVSVATALVLYEALRQREAAGMYDAPRLDPVSYRSTLFEWAYPTLAARLRRVGQAYPDLDDEGEIVRGAEEGSAVLPQLEAE